MKTKTELAEAKRYLQFVDRGIVEHFDGTIPSQETLAELAETDNVLQAIADCETLDALKAFWVITPFRLLEDENIAFAFEDQENYIKLGCPKPPKQ